MKIKSTTELFQEKQYVIVPNFIDESLRAYLQFYSLKMWSRGRWRNRDEQTPQADILNWDPLFEVLLDYKTKYVSDLVSKRLAPTYSYGRCYVNGSILNCHTDRHSCEYSVSANLFTSEELRWDLYLVDKEGKRNYVYLQPGDAVVYMGCERPHGRDPLVCAPDQYMLQIFLHYVDSDGPYADYIFDKRDRLNY